MMTASDGLTAPAALNPFHSRDVPQPPPDSVPAYTRSPPHTGSSGSYSSLPTADKLEFQDIAHTGTGGQIRLDVDSSEPLGGAGPSSSASPSDASSGGAAPIYSLNYYKPYFDVSTDLLFSRLFRALNPASTAFYTDESSPDLYGPFWVTTTLILLIAVCSNLASYLDWRYGPNDGKGTWSYDFAKLSVACSVLYSLITWVTVVLYFFLARAGQGRGLIELVSVMGYSLTPLLLVSLLLVIPLSLLQWVVVALGCVVQSWFMVKNVWVDRSNAKVTPVIAALVAGDVGLALLFKWYFF